jgi:adenine deaminase
MPARRGTPRLLSVARGDEPADLLLTGGRIFVPGTREWLREDLAIADGVIAGWGQRDAREVVEVAGAALTPGFIDAHTHLESTKLRVDEFARAVRPASGADLVRRRYAH